MQGAKQGVEDLHAHVITKIHVHICTYKVIHLLIEALLSKISDHLYAAHGDLLPVVTALDLEDDNLPSFLKGNARKIVWPVSEDIVCPTLKYFSAVFRNSFRWKMYFFCNKRS